MFFTLFFPFLKILLFKYSCLHFPFTPTQPSPPPSPESTPPLGFVHVSFVVVPINPSPFPPHYPLPSCVCVGGPPAGPSPWPPRMRRSLSRHDLLGEERWPISQRRRTKSLFLNGLSLGSFCTRIQVKLINHCQAVRIKQ